MELLDGFKANGIENVAQLDVFRSLDPSKMDVAAVLGRTADLELKTDLRHMSKEAVMFDSETPAKHLFQDLTDMKISAGGWLLKGLLKSNEYSLFFGAPGSRKSFVLLDIALHISNGLDWGGHITKESPTVLYLVGEGQGGINLRLKAASKRHNLPHNRILVSKLPGALMCEDSTRLIANAIEDIEGPVWLIVDTLHRNMGDGDESSSKDFGNILNNLDVHIKSLGTSVSIVHHVGHGNTDRSRGSSAIRGSLDSEFLVEKDGTMTNIICKKMKDALEPSPISLESHVEILGIDEDGDDITSLSLTVSTEKETLELSKFEAEILEKIWLQSVSKTELRKWAVEAKKTDKEKSVRTRTSRALASLEEKSLITVLNEVCSIEASLASTRLHSLLKPHNKSTISEEASLASHTYRCEALKPTIGNKEISPAIFIVFDEEEAMALGY